MSVKCGRCSGRHESVQDVRACYNGQEVNRVAEEIPAAYRITERQVNYLGSLLRRAYACLAGERQLDQIGKREASVLIDEMQAYLKAAKSSDDVKLPAGVIYDSARMIADGDLAGHGDPGHVKPVAPRQVLERGMSLYDVPAGRYAIKSLTGAQDYDFFIVNRPTSGKWAGYTFIQRVIGGHPDVAVRGKTAHAAMQAIVDEGVEECRTRFGREIGRCWKCGRHLTDETSRSLGIGPDCRSKE